MVLRSLVVVVGLLHIILCLFILMWRDQFRTIRIVYVLGRWRPIVSFIYRTLIVVVVGWGFRWGIVITFV